jgi:hypothetical protein
MLIYIGKGQRMVMLQGHDMFCTSQLPKKPHF